MKSSTQLEALVEQFSHWRAIKGKNRKTPPHLVKATIELIDKYPKNKIIQALGINNSTLKIWEQQFSPIAKNEFVEITDLGFPLSPKDHLQLQLQYVGLRLSVSGTCHELASFVKQLTLDK